MDLIQTIAAVGVPTLGTAAAAIRVAWGAWTKDRDAVISTLREQLATSVEREKALAVALDRSTQVLDRVGDGLDRSSLIACPSCGHDLRSTPTPTGPHRAGGVS